MPDRWAVANGNWSSTATWNGGTLPGTGDDVFADGFTVTIDQNITVLSIRTTQRTGGTAGGVFNCSSSRIITANIIGGSAICLNISGSANVDVIGNITAGTGNNLPPLTTSSSGTVTVTGNVTGGTGGGAVAVRLGSATGTLTIVGNVTAGSNTNAHGVTVTADGTLNITGTVTGGSNSNAHGVNHASTGTVNITGTCVGTSVAVGALNTTTGTIRATRAKADSGASGTSVTARFGIQNNSTGICEVEEIEYGDLGLSPTAGAISFKDLSSNVCLFYRVGLSKKTVVDSASVTIPRLLRGMDGGYLA